MDWVCRETVRGELYAGPPIGPPLQSHLFHYEPLATASAFRLLELLPGVPGTGIRCRMMNYDLQTCRPYSALSYEWNLVPGNDTIRVNGRIMQVRRNLVDFLRVLRRIFRPVTLWADAICIDQYNLKERGHQVQLMSQIFANARDVKSWLGHCRPEAIRAVEFCNHRPWLRTEWNRHHLDRHWRKALGKGNLKARVARTARGFMSTSRVRKDLQDSQTTIQDICNRIFNLCNLTYWSRLWIMPEILLGKAVKLHCGNKGTLDVENLVTSIQWASNHMTFTTYPDESVYAEDYLGLHSRWRNHASFQDAAEHFQLLQHWRRCFQDHKEEVPFAHLLQAFGNLDCLENRDRVYALLGLSTLPGEGLPVRVDYTASPGQVFLDTLHHCLRTGYLGSNTYKELCEALDLDHMDCVASLLTAQTDIELRATYHELTCRVRLLQHSKVLRELSSYPIAAYLVSRGSEYLVTSHLVCQGDIVCQLFDSNMVVVCGRGAFDTDTRTADFSNLKAIGALISFFNSDPEVEPYWSDYEPDGEIGLDFQAGRRGPQAFATLSLFDVVLLHTLYSELLEGMDGPQQRH